MSEHHNEVRGPSSKFINVLVTIDAAEIKKSGLKPGATPESPTWINDATLLKNSFFMVCTGSRGIISGQGSDKLNFKANVGDTVAFEGITVDGNSDDAVIIYGVDSTTDVFNNFLQNRYNRPQAVQPNNKRETPNGLPAEYVNRNFNSYSATVAKNGTANFFIKFALYKLSDNGQKQELVGYYRYDPTITVGQ